MKYIKKFEDVSNEWTEGMYVVLNLDKIIKNYIEDNDKKPIKKDLPDDNVGLIFNIRPEEKYPFAIKFHTDTIFEVNEDEIEREATPEEIDYIKMKMTSKKYNL
jgi:hypothetical protein